MADDAETAEVNVTAPPETHPETGVALQGEYPLNARLRAEAMSDAGVTTDADGLVSDELIEATGKRLAAERAETEANTPSLSWSRDRLVEHANGLGLAIESDANKPTILSMIEGGDTVEQLAPIAPTPVHSDGADAVTIQE